MTHIQSKGTVLLLTSTLAFSSITGHGQIVGASTTREAQFEVASLKPDDPNGSTVPTNLDLDASDYFRYQGGPVVADGYLVNYLIFAYKLRNSGEYKGLDERLPRWAQTQSHQSFQLQARAGDRPTKDSLRSMVRSMLAERFALKVHTETQDKPAWVLVKSSNGQANSGLRPHTGEPTCTTVSPKPAQPAKPRPGEAPPYCGTIILHEEEGLHLSIQDYTLPQIAGELSMLGIRSEGMEELPGLDGTQLIGHFDLDLHYASRKAPRPPEAPSADPGSDFLQAMSVQAGLEFKKKTVPVEVLIVDRLNQPTAN